MTLSSSDCRPPDGAAGAPLPDQRRAVLTIVLASYLMIILDISIVITGLPDIREGLGFSATGLSWVQNAYTLCFGGFLMLGARIGDLLGRRRVYLAGLVLFTVASLGIGLAQSPAMMLAARAIQGIGAAVLAPTTLALLSTHFQDGEERHRALAYYAATAGVGASLGLVVGGIFADWISWRVGFFMNVPVGIGLFVAASRMLQETEQGDGRLDLVGAFVSTIGMASLVYGTVRSASVGWGDVRTLGAVGGGLALLVAFLWSQRNSRQPLLPLRLLADRVRAGAYGARMLFVGAMVSFFFFSTQYMQGVLGFGALEAGLGFLPLTAVSFAASMQLPKLTRILGNGRVLVIAMGACFLGLLWMASVGPHHGYVTALALPMLLLGFGNGMALGPLTVAGVQGVEKRDAGAASGIVNVAHQLGGTMGLAILVVVFAAGRPQGMSAADTLAVQIAHTYQGGAVMMALGLAVSVMFVARASPRTRYP